MKEQNYKNHRRYLLGYHGITFFLILILFISSVYSLYVSINTRFDIRVSLMLVITSLILGLFFFYARIFASKAQDRAIRAEENLRHFVLTGKLIDPKLRISQILALRFAPDDEYIDLTHKALNENLKSDDIKRAIKNWRADYHRI